MEKITLKKEQAEAIETFLLLKNPDRYKDCKPRLLEEHVHNRPWSGHYASLNELSQIDMARALLIGYEVNPKESRLYEIRKREQALEKKFEKTPWDWHGNAFHGFSISQVDIGVTVAGTEHRAVAEFIANAREDIPYLLDEIERLQASLEGSG